ncbi:MAG: hypothetical protein AB7N91_28995 [Candidatus Tectimicrobiota bacterium]
MLSDILTFLARIFGGLPGWLRLSIDWDYFARQHSLDKHRPEAAEEAEAIRHPPQPVTVTPPAQTDHRTEKERGKITFR